MSGRRCFFLTGRPSEPKLMIGWCIIMSQSHAKSWICFVQGQGHKAYNYRLYMTVFTISSELLILLQPNLVWWYIIMAGVSCDWLSEGIRLLCSKVKVKENIQKFSVRTIYLQGHGYASYNQNITVSTISTHPFAILILMVHHHEPQHFVNRLDGCVQGLSLIHIWRCRRWP